MPYSTVEDMLSRARDRAGDARSHPFGSSQASAAFAESAAMANIAVATALQELVGLVELGQVREVEAAVRGIRANHRDCACHVADDGGVEPGVFPGDGRTVTDWEPDFDTVMPPSTPMVQVDFDQHEADAAEVASDLPPMLDIFAEAHAIEAEKKRKSR